MDKTERRFSSCSSLGKGPMETGTNDYIKFTPPSRHIGKERSLSSSSSTPSQMKNKNSHYVSSFYHPLDKNKIFLPSENSWNKFKENKIQKENVKSVDNNSKNIVFEKLTSQPFSSRSRSDSCPQVCHSNQISLPNKCHNSHASDKNFINKNDNFVFNDLLKNNSQLNNIFAKKIISNSLIKKPSNVDISANNPFAKSKAEYTDQNEPFCLVFNKKIDENILNNEPNIKNYGKINKTGLENKKFKENQDNYSLNNNKSTNNNNNIFLKNKYNDQFNNSLNPITNNLYSGTKASHKESRKFSLGQNSPLVTRKLQNNGLFSPTASSKILNLSLPLNSSKNSNNDSSNNITLNRYPFNMNSNSNIDKKILNRMNEQNQDIPDSFDVELNDLLEFNLALDPANFSNQILVSENNNTINNRKYTASHLDAKRLVDEGLIDGRNPSKDCLSVHKGNVAVDVASSYEDLNDEFDVSTLHQDLPQSSAAFSKNLQTHLINCQQNNIDKNFNKSPNILSKKHQTNSNKNLLSTNQPQMNPNPFSNNFNHKPSHPYNQETLKKSPYKDTFFNDITLYSDNTYNDNAPYNIGNLQYSPNLRKTVRGSFRSNNDIHNLRSPSDFPAKYKSTNLSTIHDEAMFNNNNNNNNNNSNNNIITDINNNIINAYDANRGFNNARRPQPKFHRLSSYEPGLNSHHKLQKSLNNNSFHRNNLNNQLSKASSEHQLTFQQNNLKKTKNLSFDETNINKNVDKNLETNLNNDNKSYVSSVFLNLTPNNNDLSNKFDFENLGNIYNNNSNNKNIKNNNNSNSFESIGPICDNIFIKNERNKNLEKDKKNINNKNSYNKNKNNNNNNKDVLSKEQLTERKSINPVRPSTLFLDNSINNKNNNNINNNDNNNNIKDKRNNKNNNDPNTFSNTQEVNRYKQVINKQHYVTNKQDANLINNNNNKNNNNNFIKNNKKKNINDKNTNLDRSDDVPCANDAAKLKNKQLEGSLDIPSFCF